MNQRELLSTLIPHLLYDMGRDACSWIVSRWTYIALVGLLLFTFFPFGQITAQSIASNPYPVAIYLFWGDGCPHCAAARPFLQDLSSRYAVNLHEYEVWYVPENHDLFQKMAAVFAFEPHGVPTIFVGEQHWEGYSDQIAQEVETAVKACAANGC